MVFVDQFPTINTVCCEAILKLKPSEEIQFALLLFLEYFYLILYFQYELVNTFVGF